MTPTPSNTVIFAPAWVWGPAGRDVELARAISDLTTGGYLGSTRELLATVGKGCGWRRDDYDRRAYCTSVLAAVLVRRRLDLAEEWLKDEPRNPDALLLFARVLVVRAIHAARTREDQAQELAVSAARACVGASLAAADDPTQLVALLHLGEAGMDLSELRCGLRSLGDLAVLAPWHLLDGALQRAPDLREAYHRLLPLCFAAPAATPWTPDTAAEEPQQTADDRARAQVAVSAADQAPAGSPLKLLRLMYAPDRDPFPDQAEEMRLRNHLLTHGQHNRSHYLRERVPAMEERWRLALWATAVKLADTWFANGNQPPYTPLADISFLAGYLHKVGALRAARLVLEWMVPYATSEPWQRQGDPGAVLAAVCRECHVDPAYLLR
jgi:hypothetical protein